MNDNICAIATPPGKGGIAIIRIVGSNLEKELAKFFPKINLENLKSHSLTYTHFYHDGKIIDEVLLGKMINPHSFTGEDTYEINCHGGILVTHKILEYLLTSEIRLAEPGEFTKRAFLNGKKTLNQAQAVMDLIDSKSEKALRLAQNNIIENKFHKLKDSYQRLITVLTELSVTIDYPEYVDLKELTNDEIKPQILKTISELEELKINSQKGMLIKNGIKTAIVGVPNVGKSTIFNRLTRSEKAIVTNVAGTTRDVLEEEVIIGDVNLLLLDTAGLRETTDIVERIGIERSRESLAEAELILHVIDGTKYEDEIEEILLNDSQKLITINNKKDLAGWKKQNLINEISFSKDDEQSLIDLETKISEIFGLADLEIDNTEFVLQTEMLAKLTIAVEKLKELEKNLAEVLMIDLIEIDLREIVSLLAEMQGIKSKDDFLDQLFKNFCLGK